jgi:hypothetical protein
MTDAHVPLYVSARGPTTSAIPWAAAATLSSWDRGALERRSG